MQQRGCQHRTRQKGLIEQAMPGPCRQAAARPGLGEAQGLHRVGNSCSEAEDRHMGGTWETHARHRGGTGGAHEGEGGTMHGHRAGHRTGHKGGIVEAQRGGTVDAQGGYRGGTEEAHERHKGGTGGGTGETKGRHRIGPTYGHKVQAQGGCTLLHRRANLCCALTRAIYLASCHSALEGIWDREGSE